MQHSTNLYSAVSNILSRPIAYHRAFREISGSTVAGLFLSQAWYWKDKGDSEDGWFYKTSAEWEEETGLSRHEQEEARRKCRSIGVLEEKKQGVPAKLYYRVNVERTLDLLMGAEPDELPLDDFLELHKPALSHGSKAALMRAKKTTPQASLVEFSDSLRMHGCKCSICGKPITRGPGKSGLALAFDYHVPLAKGGQHTVENLRPAHAQCNATKMAETPEKSSLFTQSKQGCLPKANKDVYPKQTRMFTQNKLSIYTETTTENTHRKGAEIESEQRPNDPMAQRFSSKHPWPELEAVGLGHLYKPITGSLIQQRRSFVPELVTAVKVHLARYDQPNEDGAAINRIVNAIRRQEFELLLGWYESSEATVSELKENEIPPAKREWLSIPGMKWVKPGRFIYGSKDLTMAALEWWAALQENRGEALNQALTFFSVEEKERKTFEFVQQLRGAV